MQLPKTITGTYVNPFESEEEREFFEERLGGRNLNIHTETNNYWDKFYVKVTKDWQLMNTGYEYNLADPLDNLRYRVLKNNPLVAQSWEERFNRGEYRFALVNEDYEIQKESSATDLLTKAWTHFGSIQNSKQKLAEFLGIYMLETKSLKEVAVDSSIDFLRKEVKKYIESDIATIVRLATDEKATVKLFILNALRANAITKKGRNSYNIPGEGVDYMYNELVDYLADAKEITSDVYLKIESLIKNAK
jgi:hypothetical protein